MAIRRDLRQLWKTADTPDPFTVVRETWRTRNPQWTFRLWTNRDLEALAEDHFPQLADIHRGEALDICRADLGRYVVLEAFGGAYADLDCECLAPLDDHLDGADLLLAPEPRAHVTEEIRAWSGGLDVVLCPSFLAAAPAHPLWAHVRRRIVESRTTFRSICAPLGQSWAWLIG